MPANGWERKFAWLEVQFPLLTHCGRSNLNQCSISTRKRTHHPGNESWSWFWARFAVLRFCCLWCGQSCFLSIGRESTIVWTRVGVTITNAASVNLRRITSFRKISRLDETLLRRTNYNEQAEPMADFASKYRRFRMVGNGYGKQQDPETR